MPNITSTITATSVLRLKDGENQLLAGLISDEDRRTANKVPFIGEIPILGRLFGSHSDEGIKTKIVLSITPRILRNIQRAETYLAEFDGGTETSFRVRPESGGSGGQTFRALAAGTSRVELITIAPVGSGGSTINATLPAPHALTINP